MIRFLGLSLSATAILLWMTVPVTPVSAATGDVVIVGDATDKFYTYTGGTWDAGVALPSGEGAPRGIAVKPNGDVLIVGDATDKFYTYTGGAWDAGVALPTGEGYPTGIAVKPNGDVVIVGYGTDKFYTYSGGTWDTGVPVPTGEGTPRGIAVKSNGDVVIVGDVTDRFYTYSGGTWDTGVPVPTGEGTPRGIAVKSNGDVVIVGDATDRFYTYTGGAWDASLPVPAGETSPTGIAVVPVAPAYRVDGAAVVWDVGGGMLMLAEVYIDGGEDSAETLIDDFVVSWRVDNQYVAASRIPRLYSLHDHCGYSCNVPDGQGHSLVAAWVSDQHDGIYKNVYAELHQGSSLRAARQARSSYRTEHAAEFIVDGMRRLGASWGVELIAGEQPTREGLEVLRTLLPQVQELGLGIVSERIAFAITAESSAGEPAGVGMPDIVLDPLRSTAGQLGVSLGTMALVAGLALVVGAWIMTSKVSNPGVGMGVIAGGVVPLVIVSGMLGTYGYIALGLAAMVALARAIRDHVPSG